MFNHKIAKLSHWAIASLIITYIGIRLHCPPNCGLMYSADCGLADSWTHGLAPEVFCGLNASFFADVKQLLNKMIHESAKCESMSP